MLGDCVGEFVCFFGDGCAEGLEGLLSVPRTASGSAEGLDDVNNLVEIMLSVNWSYFLLSEMGKIIAVCR